MDTQTKQILEETETELEKAAEEYERERVYESELARYFTYLETLEDGESPKMRMPSRDTEYFLNADIIESFKAGAGWQKRKMVGSAFEGGAYSYRNGYIHVSCDIDENTTDIKLGDRVKLIVVPVK